MNDPISSSSDVGDATSVSVISMLSKRCLRSVRRLEAPLPNGAVVGVFKASPARGRLEPGAASFCWELRSCEMWCISCSALVGREAAGGGTEAIDLGSRVEEAADGRTSGGSGGSISPPPPPFCEGGGTPLNPETRAYGGRGCDGFHRRRFQLEFLSLVVTARWTPDHRHPRH